MEQFICIHCYEFFPKSPKNKDQNYCNKPDCQRARKAAWKRTKMINDPEFRNSQKLSNKKWAQNNPGYWKEYRQKNPLKEERNRILQSLRNRRRIKKPAIKSEANEKLIAKVDALIPKKVHPFGQFWLVPVIAKVDAIKVNMFEISRPYQ